jgi:tetratricopeptide (TPR) repeat protein
MKYILTNLLIFPFLVFAQTPQLDSINYTKQFAHFTELRGKSVLEARNYAFAMLDTLQHAAFPSSDYMALWEGQIGTTYIKDPTDPDYGRAIQWYDKAISYLVRLKGTSLAYNTGVFLLNRGVAHQYLNQRKLALNDFEQALFYFQSNPAAESKAALPISTLFSNLCFMSFDIGNYQKALEFCSRSIAYLKKKNLPATDASFLPPLANMGQCYQSLGAFDLAFRCFENARNIFNQSSFPFDAALIAPIYDGLGQIYLKRSNPDSALYLYEECYKLLRDNSGNNYYKSYLKFQTAKVYREKGDFTEAEKRIRFAISRYRKSRVINLGFLSEYYRELGITFNMEHQYGKALVLMDSAGLTLTDTSSMSNESKQSANYILR